MRKIAFIIMILLLVVNIGTVWAESDVHHEAKSLSVYSVIPFILMLLSIAVIPLKWEHWWEDNFHKLIISAVLGIPMGVFFFIFDYHELLHVLEEYIAFIIYVGSLFVISGGILLRGDVKVSPKVNTAIIAIGACLASFIGTPGASMLLIRPLLRINGNRKYVKHTVIFFIFLVSNIGGCLTPLGDPPLYLGYLEGVPFTWTFVLWKNWLFMVILVLIVFYFFDSYYFRKENKEELYKGAGRQKLQMVGLNNFLWLGGVMASVAFLPYFPLREIVMLLMVVISLKTTPKGFREENKFTYHPVIEVAFLFIGIFLTMIPALYILRTRGTELGVTEPWQFFWITGFLSSFLDNAPTYLTFFSLGQSLGGENLVALTGVAQDILIAISIGAVFMGANTYIGNGPNFMVKAISDEAGYKMPSFLGYMVWSFGILVPLFLIVTFVTFVWGIL